MVRINCGAIPENLMESELFGYERGAFAGALKTKKGLIELADGGTVFLDEIGELPMAMQTKLLTFLDDRKFKRIGALEDTAVDVRIIAATNRNLEEAIKAGQFREDLFYRLNVMQIEIPPLRDRREDIPVLCDYYLDYYNKAFARNIEKVDPDFMRSCSCMTGRAMSGSLKIFLSAVFSSARKYPGKTRGAGAGRAGGKVGERGLHLSERSEKRTDRPRAGGRGAGETIYVGGVETFRQ